MNASGNRIGQVRRLTARGRALRWMLVLLLAVTLTVSPVIPLQGDTVFAATHNEEQTVAPMGDPDDCWWVGLICVVLP